MATLQEDSASREYRNLLSLPPADEVLELQSCLEAKPANAALIAHAQTNEAALRELRTTEEAKHRRQRHGDGTWRAGGGWSGLFASRTTSAEVETLRTAFETVYPTTTTGGFPKYLATREEALAEAAKLPPPPEPAPAPPPPPPPPPAIPTTTRIPSPAVVSPPLPFTLPGVVYGFVAAFPPLLVIAYCIVRNIEAEHNTLT